MPDLVQIRTALLSTSDKTDLVPFASALASRGVNIISTGGTARALNDAGISVTPVDRVTGFPEMLDGRVKTLHPSVHAALLAVRSNPEHMAALQRHGIGTIDLVCINLYPFERTIGAPGIEKGEAIEQIDIGGPSMIRSAAKNFESVTVVTAPRQYDRVVSELTEHDGCTSARLREDLAAAAFARTSEYDAAIASFLTRRSPEAFPEVLRLRYIKADALRYGENPHQDAALYRDPASTGPTVVNAQQLHGKALSYNNLNDAAAALELAKALRKLNPELIGASVVKHASPCGAACDGDARSAVDAAIAADPISAYGGILAVNRAIDGACAERITAPDSFFEVILAPSFDDDALDLLRERWKHVRLLGVGDRPASPARKLDYRSIPGGMLVQDRNTRRSDPAQWLHHAGPEPTPDQTAVGAFLEMVGRSALSNAVVLGAGVAGAQRIVGIGAGQTDRLSACRLAAARAGDHAAGSVAYSDAFFPFSDAPEALIDAGVSVLIHPGGSRRDDETFDLCRRRGVTCLTTGVRQFRH